MIINHNLGAMNALAALNSNSNALNSVLQKLSTGKKINSAADNASGYAISQKMQGQINGLNQATQNAQDGISMIQTASGALNETTSLLQNMRQLAVQASNSTTTASDRADLQTQFNQLASQINNIGNTTQFNTQNLLNGGIGSGALGTVTQATAATHTVSSPTNGTAGTPTFIAAGTSITVDGQTFNLSGTKMVGTAPTDIASLGAVTSGSTKLSDLVTITGGGLSALTFTDKSTGTTSSIKFTGNDAALGTVAGDTASAYSGAPTTMSQAGLLGTAVTSYPQTLTSADSFNISIGGGAATTVSFTGSTTLNSGTDTVNALNAALQNAGLSGQVTAALGWDSTNNAYDQVQLISTSGKDLALTGTSVNLTAATGLSAALTPQNVNEVVGAGATGTGFTAEYQIGANTGQTMSLTIGDMRATALGITGNAGQQGYSAANNVTDGTNNLNSQSALDITNTTNADTSINVIDTAIQKVTTEQANLGASQNRLQSTINNLGTSSQNLTTAQSGITDVNMAAAMSQFTQDNVLQQAAVSMLAQANQQPQLVLKLLG